MDHCCLGSEDAGPDGEAVPALKKPFLIMYDVDSEAIYCLLGASKAVNEYVVYCVKSVIDELGYNEVRIAFKSDAAPELLQTREQVRNLRSAPTTPINVPVKESKMNGVVERAAMSVEGQFRTIQDHVEGKVAAVDDPQIDVKHPMKLWRVWWVSAIMHRYVVRPKGLTAYELIICHKDKILIVR